MVATKWLARAVIVVGLMTLTTAPAQALTLNIVAGGLEADNLNYGCPTAAGICVLAARNYGLAADVTATGSIEIDLTGTIVDIALYVSSATFNPTGPGSPITFGPATYLAHLTGVTTTPIGPGAGGIAPKSGTGSVSGDINGSPFSVSPFVSINCQYPGGAGQCGISFGEAGFTNLLGHDWKHTFNVTVVALPEPATALLVTLGLAGFLLRTRRG
jgi:hypothetical protein